MQNNNMLPSAARYENAEARAEAMELHRSGAAVPMPEGAADRLKTENLEQASGTETPYEVPGNTVPNASDEVSAGPVPNDTQLQMVLRNAHPLQDTSLSLTERVNAFKLLEREGSGRKSCWKNSSTRPNCEECGKKHTPPHLSREQNDAVTAAYREGERLCQELEMASNPPGPSRNDTTAATRADIGDSAAPSTRKAKNILCTRCAKWHRGGAKECKTPMCVEGCGLAHPPFEDCGHAAMRFARVKDANRAKGKSAAPPVPSPSTAASNSGFDVGSFAALASSTSDRGELMRNFGTLLGNIGSLLSSFPNEKRPAAEPAENAGASQKKKKNKKTGQGNSCQPPQPHHKGPNKPDDKGKGRAIKPEPAWE